MVRVRTILAGTILLIGVYYLYRCKYSTFDCTTLSYVFDDIPSEETQHELQAYYTELTTNKFPLDLVHASVLESHPLIKTISLQSTWNGKKIVVFTALTPRACTSNKEILLENGLLCPQEKINPAYTSRLPQIIVQKTDLQACANWITACGPVLFKDFSVAWHGKQTIVLHDTSAGVQFIGNCTSLPDNRLHVQCKQLQEQDPLKLARTKNYIFDIRFKNKIIMRGIPKGGSYEKINA